jgi:hypothetical protein
MTATEPLPDDSLTILNTRTAEIPATDEDDFDEEFLPRVHTKRHWLTSVLIYLVVWGGGFLVGVLVDRMLAG